MHKYLLILFSTLLIFTATGQSTNADTNYINSTYSHALNLNTLKTDSVKIYAEEIAKLSKALNYKPGMVYSIRLMGIYYELKNDYDLAINQYFTYLEEAKKINNIKLQISAYTDLAIIYTEGLKKPEKSKEMLLQIAPLYVKDSTPPVKRISNFVNLGAIYNKLNMSDSALYFLYQGLAIANAHKGEVEFASLYNNMGNAYFKKKEYQKALDYFSKNLAEHQIVNDADEIWLDKLNIADVYIELKQFDSATIYANDALKLSLASGSLSNQKDSYALLTKLYDATKNYTKAYETQKQWYNLDTSLLNIETNETVAKLQEQFNAAEREKENRLLEANIEKEKLRQKVFGYLAAAATIIGILITIALFINKRANRKLQEVNGIITNQNNKLTQLNAEKNSLISVVSHDLSTPFASVKIWAQVLQTTDGNLNPDQHKAVERILQSAGKGEMMIRNILDVEKAETNKKSLEIEHINICSLVEQMIKNDFEAKADKKDIQIHFEKSSDKIFLFTDRNLLERVFENLLSNAIKFSAKRKAVWITLYDTNTDVIAKIRDEGVGIRADELPNLFLKYSKVSSIPTAGETSTGLGLSIVKRIVDELNGTIHCESEFGKGSIFTVTLKK